MNKEFNHKIVCWGDYAIPCPIWANWMVFDEDNTIRFFETPPYRPYGHFNWWNSSEEEHSFEIRGMDIKPPEFGEWDTQIYWIG